MRHLLGFCLLLMCIDTAMAQNAPMAIDSIVHTSDSVQVLEPRTPGGDWKWDRDSISLVEYHHVAEVLAYHPGIFLNELGNLGQPVSLTLFGSTPFQQSLSINGLAFDDLITGMTESYLASTEDISTITVHPQYQSFWFGNPGDVLAVDIEEKEWNAPRPITRLRHTEAPGEYLYTDAMFTLNPSPESNVYLAATRTTIGTTSSNNAARYANNRYESWNIRLRYSRDLNDLLQLRTAVRYNDHFTLLNGGVAGSFSPGAEIPLSYDDETTGSFASEAFDSKAAILINESMETLRQRYNANIALQMKWTEDSSQVSRLQLGVVSDVRRFRDNLQGLRTDTNAIAIPFFNLTDQWSLLHVQLSHATSLAWARLSLRGNLGRYAAFKGGNAMDESGIDAGARGRLDILLGPAEISGFAALDHRYDQSTISMGAGVELPLGSWNLWGGISYSPRIRSMLETAYQSSLVVVNGDRTPDLDKVSVLEGGIRWNSSVMDVDLRGFVRREDRFQYIQSAAYQDTVLGRYVLTVGTIPDGTPLTFIGGSASVRTTIWRFHIDQQLSWTRLDSDHPVLGIFTVPELQYSGALYYRGSLIEGTLDLKVGGRILFCTDYMPQTYHPEAGIFALPYNMDAALASYTDMMRVDLFLFASIKQRATLHISMHNVLDAEYITSGFYPMYDRALRFGVDWLFFD